MCSRSSRSPCRQLCSSPFSRGPLGDAITGSPEAAHVAARSLPWLLPAAFMQLLASIATSALAARDSYGVAALAYGGGAVASVVVFLALASRHGLVSLAWGLALNGAVAFGVPLAVAALARDHDLGHVRAGGAAILLRLGRLGRAPRCRSRSRGST